LNKALGGKRGTRAEKFEKSRWGGEVRTDQIASKEDSLEALGRREKLGKLLSNDCSRKGQLKLCRVKSGGKKRNTKIAFLDRVANSGKKHTGGLKPHFSRISKGEKR